MRMKFFIIGFAALMSAAATLSSCSREDGDWDPMEWRTGVRNVKEDGMRLVVVPQTGGTYEYTCRNYKSFWLEYVIETTEKPTGNLWQFNGLYNTYRHEDTNPLHISSPATEVNANDNKLSISVKPNDTGKTRYIMVTVTAGDIFDQFIYRQE